MVTNGHRCFYNCTIGVQLAIGIVPTGIYIVVIVIFMTMYRVNSSDIIIPI